ncbi:UDP-N-acetylglucosamine 2-epimerase [Algisphaera agarilytica]|uniref:UDP-hydrolyzing UDP-N-acetyl-D-glucosamine 2-epimerase n=1 Tax=Algisphaera agarilytica TaxID=1385975 RepID=A0A7X0H5S1_9BACT|nr:UDP-N-acetylglucosamine 2-epimerase [Algisphaera agarilytica]MBB6429803.1 UDP-hydrolyzing UDP-N-acetyl-D-glucosamine 2-epimerase [Algisphaera agarilytica]
MASPRNIAVVTGTRAEYGLLETVMRAIDAHPKLSLQCVAAGMHLVTGTHQDIAFPIAAKVRMQKPDRVGRHHDAVATGRGISVFAEAFAQLKPDVVLVLGDRIEAFAAASTASIAGIRVAHLHGGDRAEGVADEAMRHAISKLAHLHFPATAQSRKRLIRMGEDPATVFNHGSPAADGLSDIAPAEDAPEIIVMQHPIGDDDATEHQRMRGTLQATAKFSRLVMAPNHDPGRNGIAQAIHEAGVEVVDHLPRHEFIARLKAARLIVGNSSAGLIEAAVCKTPAVNIGPRQGGRETPNSVVSCGYGKRGVTQAIQQTLGLNTRRFRQPYGRGETGQQIAQSLASLRIEQIPVRKRNAY